MAPERVGGRGGAADPGALPIAASTQGEGRRCAARAAFGNVRCDLTRGHGGRHHAERNENGWRSSYDWNDERHERERREAEEALDRVREAADHLGRLADLKKRNVSTIREAYAHAQEIVLAALGGSR